MNLTNIDTKVIPFSKERQVSFYHGTVQNDEGQEIFLYSLSCKPHLGKYRMTVTFEHADIRQACVLVVDAQLDPMIVASENDTAKEIWNNKDHIKHKQLKQAVNLILDHHLA